MSYNIEDLKIFAKVVEAASMSAAASELGLSPAVISKRIARLEKELGARLLQRSTRQVAPTEVGQGFYDRIFGLISDFEEARSYLAGHSAEISGTLRVSAPTSFGRMHIAPHLPSFMRLHPNLRIELMLSDEFCDLIGGGFDTAIRISEPKDSTLIARKLASVRRVLCAAPSYLADHGIPKSIEDLERHQCLQPHNGDVWRLEGPFGSVVYRPAGQLSTNSSEVVRESVIAGLGIALRSTWDIGREIQDGRLVHVLPDYEGSKHVTLSAVYPSRQFLPMKVIKFVDHLGKTYVPIPYWDRAVAKIISKLD